MPPSSIGSSPPSAGALAEGTSPSRGALAGGALTEGPPLDEAPEPTKIRPALPLLLFGLTTISVLYSGSGMVVTEGDWIDLFRPSNLVQGASFAGPLLVILLCHEFGHYFAARWHRVPASLPYFLPMPISPFGTWGAIIAMPDRIASRRALLDIGAAGPLAGMAVAIPVLIWGLRHSVVKPLEPHGLLEGQSIFYWALKRLVLGTPIPDGYDVFLHPAAFAGWAGLFVTMINLIPFGQLDGGHIAYALLGPRQNAIARWVHWALIPLFLSNFATHLLAARAQGFPADWAKAVASNSTFWLLWFGILGLLSHFGGRDHPPTDPGEPLGPGRTVVAVLCLLLFVLIFMPAPLIQS